MSPELHDHLDGEGTFGISPRSEIGGISAEEAVRLATALVRSLTGYHDMPRNFHGERLSHYEREHGDIINFRMLRRGLHVYLPSTPYGVVADTFPEAVHEVFDSHYIVPICNDRGIQVMTVSVPVQDRGLWIDEIGRVLPPGGTGSIPITPYIVFAGAEYPMPLTSECAVALVGAATGRRIVQVPEAIHPGRPWGPPSCTGR